MSNGNNHHEGAGYPGPGDATTQTTNPPGGEGRPDVVAPLVGEGDVSAEQRAMADEIAHIRKELGLTAPASRRAECEACALGRKLEAVEAERDELKAAWQRAQSALDVARDTHHHRLGILRDMLGCRDGEIAETIERLQRQRGELAQARSEAEAERDKWKAWADRALGEGQTASAQLEAKRLEVLDRSRRHADLAESVTRALGGDIDEPMSDEALVYLARSTWSELYETRGTMADLIGRVLAAIGREHLLIEGPVSCDALVAEVERVVRDLHKGAANARIERDIALGRRARPADSGELREQVASAMRILAGGVLDGALPWEDCARVIRLLAGAIAPKGEEG